VLNLYKISRKDDGCAIPVASGIHKCAIVVAATEDAARKIHPGSSIGSRWVGVDYSLLPQEKWSSWVSSAMVNVELVGTAAEDLEEGTSICADFLIE